MRFFQALRPTESHFHKRSYPGSDKLLPKTSSGHDEEYNNGQESTPRKAPPGTEKDCAPLFLGSE